MTKSIAIIGAGVSGIACALTLIDEGFAGKIIILEKGNEHYSRICPVDKNNICSECSPCNTISGFGGAIHYGNSIKLSCFPSGSRLFNMLEDKSISYQNIALSYFSKTPFNFITPTKKDSSFIKKEYPIGVLSSNAVKSILDDWYQKISNSNNVKILFNREVTTLSKYRDKFVINCSMNKGNKTEIIFSDVLVACMGRAGFRKTKKFIEELELKSIPPKISIGFRFLIPNYIAQKISEIHPDFKTSADYNGFKYKTFCFCGGYNGGYIKHANHKDFMFIDGSISDKENASDFSNFAILSQLTDETGNYYDYNWVMKNVIIPYINLNSIFKGKPILQSYTDFKNKRITNTSTEHLVRLNSKIYDAGNLTTLIPSKKQHEGFCSFFENLIKEFCRISQVKESLDEILSQISVLGLEMENIWDEMELSHNMETSTPSLFICGDSSGKAHGILQAFIGGVAAAKGIIENL